MANGQNHAKQILIDETLGYVKKLENGSADDLHVIGRTLSKVARMACATFEANLRTVEDCEGLRKGCQGKTASSKPKNPIKIKLGPLAYEGFVTPALLMALPNIVTCVGGLFAIGKWQNWW